MEDITTRNLRQGFCDINFRLALFDFERSYFTNLIGTATKNAGFILVCSQFFSLFYFLIIHEIRIYSIQTAASIPGQYQSHPVIYKDWQGLQKIPSHSSFQYRYPPCSLCFELNSIPPGVFPAMRAACRFFPLGFLVGEGGSFSGTAYGSH